MSVETKGSIDLNNRCDPYSIFYSNCAYEPVHLALNLKFYAANTRLPNLVRVDSFIQCYSIATLLLKEPRMSETPEIDDNLLSDPFKTRCALLVSVLALVLAVASLGGSNAAKEATMENILAANAYNFYQAKNQRQTAYKIAADDLELQLKGGKVPAETRPAFEKKLADYQKNIVRYESEPETGEGKKELMQRAKAHEQKRDEALERDPWFDYAEALLQIGIVLTSVAIITGKRAFFNVSAVLGMLGIFSALNGYFLIV